MLHAVFRMALQVPQPPLIGAAATHLRGSVRSGVLPPPSLDSLTARGVPSSDRIPAASAGGRRRMAEQRLTPEQLAEIQRQQQAQQRQWADADMPPHQHVPVLLSIGYGGPALTAPPTSPRIVDASTVNTTRCIRYAAWYDPSNPDASREPNATEGSGGSADAAAAAWRRPPLDLSACQRSVLEVSTASQRVLVQVSC